MVDSDMTLKKHGYAKTFLALLCLSASAVIPAQAADTVFLPDISAEQIANDTVRSYDSRTGLSIVTAPTFDPFEQDNTLAGTAALRSGPSETTIDGRRVSGGAFLDLKMIYTSPSDDPYDLRGYERSFYVSGEPINRIRQEARTLDCSANTAEVSYQDSYYTGFDDYGYLAGLYLLLPQYRGHRGYWSGGSRYRPLAGSSDSRRSGRFGKYGGHSGYSSGHGYYDGRGHDRDGRRTGDGGRGHNGGVTGRGGRDGASGNSDTRRSGRHNGRNSVIGGSSERREYRRQRGVVTGAPLQTSRENRAERQSERAASERAERRRLNRGQNGAVRANTRRSGSTIRRTTRQPAMRETVTNRGVNPAGATPAPIARQAPPRPVSRPAPVRRSEPKAERKSKPRPVSKPRRASRSLNREVDRSFRKNDRARRGKQMNFFPMLGTPMLGGYTRPQSTVVTNYRCVREEMVTLHIPQERLDAARFDGLTLVVVDNAERDVPVYLPPNYIEGFRTAASGLSAARNEYYSGSYPVPSTTVVTPQPRYNGSYPQN